MPYPRKGERKKDYIKRAIPYFVKEGDKQNQAVAKAYNFWKEYPAFESNLNFKEWVIIQESNIKQIAKDAGIDITGLDIKQLKMGIEVEKEHDGRWGKDTNVTKKDLGTTLKIAVAHIREHPTYYTGLDKMEKEEEKKEKD